MGAATLIAVLSLAVLAVPTPALRSLVELESVYGDALNYGQASLPYNWNDHTPDGLLRGSWDLPTSDPRLQPAPEGYPEQVSALYYGPTSLRIGWITGQGAVGRGELQPGFNLTQTWVELGEASLAYTLRIQGNSSYYNQTYWGFPGARNYTSPQIHAVVVEGLVPGQTYFFRVGDPLLQAWSEELNITMPADSSVYPMRLGIVGDLGQTYNSSSTIDNLIAAQADLNLLVGDLSYADTYIANGSLDPGLTNHTWDEHLSKKYKRLPWRKMPSYPLSGSFQPRWDTWGRLMTPALSSTPWIMIHGNHEIEKQPTGESFLAYKTRYMPNHEASGSSDPLYFALKAGPVHFIFLSVYTPFDEDSDQYAWLVRELDAINRTETPWVVASFHQPWYSSYASSYQESNCHRLVTEPLLYEVGVDLVLNGHVHAYERTWPVHNWTLDDCGPMHIILGDGGNVEKLATQFVDSPGACDGAPKHGSSFSPLVCPQMLYDGKFCPPSQPAWSAMREPAFGFGTLDILNETHALYAWQRTGPSGPVPSDQVMVVRQPELCGFSA